MVQGQQPPGGEHNAQDPTANPYRQPGYQQPNPYQQPGHQQPGSPPPGPPPPDDQQPGYPSPDHHQPGYGQPGYAQPGYPPPVHPQPGYPQPDHRQPGYQQPGYPLPGYPPLPGSAQTHPYPQPTGPQYQDLGQPGGRGPSDDRRKTTITAIVAVAAVLITAAVTGFVVLKKDDGKGTVAGGDSTPAASGKPGAAPSEEAGPTPSADNPRDGSPAGTPQITGWKVVTNPGHSTQFDVPPDWEVANSGLSSGFEKDDGTPVTIFSAPAFYKSTWCSQDVNGDGKPENNRLGATGTKGGKGAKDTASGAVNEAGGWAWAAYALTEPEAKIKDKVKVSKAEPYTTTSGLKGHVATATARDVTKKTKCDTDGKSIAFTFVNAKGDYTSWVLYANTGVTGEIPDATIRKILSTVRLLK